MSGKVDEKSSHNIEELEELTVRQQAELFADFYAKTRNELEPVKDSDFPEFHIDNNIDTYDILVEPSKIVSVIKRMNYSERV